MNKLNLVNQTGHSTIHEQSPLLISVISIFIPPLRDRREDIRPLALSFLQKYAKKLGKKISGIDETFFEDLESYDWPGNVHELQNAAEYAINMLSYPGCITPDSLHKHIRQEQASALPENINLEHIEREIIRNALTHYGSSRGNRKLLAQKLGIGTATLYRKIKKYHLDSDENPEFT